MKQTARKEAGRTQGGRPDGNQIAECVGHLPLGHVGFRRDAEPVRGRSRGRDGPPRRVLTALLHLRATRGAADVGERERRR